MAPAYDDALRRTRQLTVSVEQLDGIAAYCADLISLIPDARDTAYDADRTALTGAAGRQTPLGSTNIGGVPDLCSRMTGVHREVDAALRDIALCLDRTSRVVTRIAAEFDTVDKRNEVKAETFRAYIAGQKR
jgi:hypothetical protein